MKLFIYIISAYCVVLSLLPCGCGEKCNDFVSHKSLNIEEEHVHSAVDNCCSPFCSCAGSHSPSSVVKSFDYAFATDKEQEYKVAIYKQNVLISFLEPLWRPPQA